MPRKKPSKSGPAPVVEWKTTAQIAATVTRKGMRLYVGLQPFGTDDGLWGVLALETPVIRKKNVLDAGRAVLDNHSHDIIGAYDLATAIHVADGYVRAWLRGEKPTAQSCECAVIDPTATAKPSREKPPKQLKLTKKEIAAAVYTASAAN